METESNSVNVCVQIETLRASIDQIDLALVNLLSERSAVVKQIQQLKQLAGLPMTDRDREQKIITRLQSLCPDLDPHVIGKVYEVIFSAAKTSAIEKECSRSPSRRSTAEGCSDVMVRHASRRPI
jgi:chorismate mutase